MFQIQKENILKIFAIEIIDQSGFMLQYLKFNSIFKIGIYD
jgi:hypothetical protein